MSVIWAATLQYVLFKNLLSVNVLLTFHFIFHLSPLILSFHTCYSHFFFSPPPPPPPRLTNLRSYVSASPIWNNLQSPRSHETSFCTVYLPLGSVANQTCLTDTPTDKETKQALVSLPLSVDCASAVGRQQPPPAYVLDK